LSNLKNIAQSRKAWFLGTPRIFGCKQWMALAQAKEHPVFQMDKYERNKKTISNEKYKM